MQYGATASLPERALRRMSGCGDGPCRDQTSCRRRRTANAVPQRERSRAAPRPVAGQHPIDRSRAEPTGMDMPIVLFVAMAIRCGKRVLARSHAEQAPPGAIRGFRRSAANPLPTKKVLRETRSTTVVCSNEER